MKIVFDTLILEEHNQGVVERHKKAGAKWLSRNVEQLTGQVEQIVNRIQSNKQAVSVLNETIDKDERRLQAIEDGEFDLFNEPSHPGVGQIYTRLRYHDEDLNR